ncbi:MAG: hypothetical protein K2H33_07075 [Muribaculaceae bacterium]|nr:hypothetical protein [Muribaculaceae bacterium]
MKNLFFFLIAAMIASVMNAKTPDSYKYIYEPGTIHIYENQYRYIRPSFYMEYITDYSVTLVLDVQPKGKGQEVTLIDLCSNDLYNDNDGPYKVYEEDGVLYKYYSLSKIQPIINMTAHKGDKLYLYKDGKRQKDYFTVTDEKIINIKGVERRRLQLETGPDGDFYWLEGIGSDHKLWTLSMSLGDPTPGCFYWPYLVKCYHGDNCVLSRKDFYISTSIDNVTVDESDPINMHIYDLTGRPVTNPQSGHIYILNGKKIIW